MKTQRSDSSTDWTKCSKLMKTRQGKRSMVVDSRKVTRQVKSPCSFLIFDSSSLRTRIPFSSCTFQMVALSLALEGTGSSGLQEGPCCVKMSESRNLYANVTYF